MTMNEPLPHRQKVGGLWEEMGQLQFEYLVSQGLKPEHKLLDVGCGSLRGGLHFVRYLDKGHYFGLDIDRELLKAGMQEVIQAELQHKEPNLALSDNFNFAGFDETFDYALAQSVFTHLPINTIIRCIMNIEPVMRSGGRFFATFFENTEGKHNLEPIQHPTKDGSRVISYFDQDSYHYDFATFQWICEDTTLQVEHIGDWGHPRDQRLMVFTKTAGA